MSFTTWASAFTDDVSTITAAFLNQIRVDVGRAVDGNAGGTYTPSAVLAINGAGGGSFFTDKCSGLVMAVGGTSTPGLVFSAASASYYPAANGMKEVISLPSSSTYTTRFYGHNITSYGIGLSTTVNADWDETGRQFNKDVTAGTASELAHVVNSSGAALHLRAYTTNASPFAESAWEQSLSIKSNNLAAASVPSSNTAYPISIIKAWGSITTAVSPTPMTINDGFNVSTVAITGGTDVLVTLHTAMADTNYAVVVTGNDTASSTLIFGVLSKTTTTFVVRCTTDAGANVDLDANVRSFGFIVMGRQ